MLRKIAYAAIGVLAAGAAFAATVTQDYIATTYRMGTVSRASAEGAPVEIYGVRGGEAGAIAQSMRLPGWFSQRNFVLARRGSHGRSRFVMVFGASAPSPAICSNPAAVPQRAGGAPQSVLGAFCTGSRADTYAVLRSDALGSPGTRAFEQAMGQLLLVMLPRRNPNIGDRDRCAAGNC